MGHLPAGLNLRQRPLYSAEEWIVDDMALNKSKT